MSAFSRLVPRRDSVAAPLADVLDAADTIILGKRDAVRLALCCLLARGHLLLEDVPGVGKTTLAHTLAKLLGLGLKRVQFTSDLMPADILGVSIFVRESGEFRFQAGPVFAEFLLADEINRGTPKTQSALLEAMEERQVTVDGESRPVPEPFFVIATQNPLEQIGTFPLPESQLDRFLMRVGLGFPNPDAELDLLRGQDRREQVETLTPLVDVDTLLAAQARVREVHVADSLLEYIRALLQHSRNDALFARGLSPRAGLGLKRAAQAFALTDGRGHVLPEDIQGVLPSVAGHRLQPMDAGQRAAGNAVTELLEAVPLP